MSKVFNIKNSVTNLYSSDSFSSTDLSKDNEDYGIVFPFKKVEQLTPSVSSIININHNKAILAHTEHRLARNIKDSEIEYLKGMSISFVKTPTFNFKPNIVQSLVGQKEYTEERAYGVTNIDTFPTSLEKSDSFFAELYEVLENVDITANTEFVIDSNITKKTFLNKAKSKDVYNSFYYDYHTPNYTYPTNVKEDIKVLDDRDFLDNDRVKLYSIESLLFEFEILSETYPDTFKKYFKANPDKVLDTLNEVTLAELQEIYINFRDDCFDELHYEMCNRY